MGRPSSKTLISHSKELIVQDVTEKLKLLFMHSAIVFGLGLFGLVFYLLGVLLIFSHYQYMIGVSRTYAIKHLLFMLFHGHPPRPIHTRTQQLIHWLPSPDPWLTLNTDGSSLGNPGYAGAGGLIRNSMGVWLKGFYRHIGRTTSVCAELWAIRDGLQLAWSMGYCHVILQLDAQIVISLLTQQMASTPWHLTLVTDCKSLLQRDWQVQIQHVYREANKCADLLEKYGTSQATNFVILNEPPSDLVAILLWVALGMATPRLCNLH
ncbi:hypothetical protein L1049_024254 [Liquidambar formosana]|uniref:RNase H type-1 domain-containing protein n=1 Tax=Liquidambar formosana TaxID=63359 RepID=A0AAP0WYD9_LIQFO